MTTTVEKVKSLVEKEHREALNLLCANYNLWHLKDALISMLSNCYVMRALDMEKEFRSAIKEDLCQR